MSSANPAPAPSEIAGRFEIVEKLGAGAFGTVYKARDKVLGRLLAIKTIRMEGLAASQAGLAEMLERFRREAQVAAQLKHPGIVTIYDIGEAQGISYISMELIDGVGLDRVIAESSRIPVERAAGLAAQVADALDFAHRNGVVHRDIKPANIMIEPGDRVKVTDFGIAKPTDSAEHLTLTGSLLGTPSYMSPEQARGSVLDGRSDLFSLGCVLYEMVTGRKAFRGDSITALLFKIITEEPQPIRELDSTLPERLAETIAKAIAKAPENRYQSGRALADDLLTLARPGSLPTLRSLDTPTLPLASAGETTALRPVTDRATQAAAPAPTIRTPAPTTRRATTVRAPVPAAPAPAPRPPLAPARGRRFAPALVLGLGFAALLVAAGLGFGAWAFLARRGPEPEPVAATSQTQSAVATTPSDATATHTVRADGRRSRARLRPPAARLRQPRSRATAPTPPRRCRPRAGAPRPSRRHGTLSRRRPATPPRPGTPPPWTRFRPRPRTVAPRAKPSRRSIVPGARAASPAPASRAGAASPRASPCRSAPPSERSRTCCPPKRRIRRRTVPTARCRTCSERGSCTWTCPSLAGPSNARATVSS